MATTFSLTYNNEEFIRLGHFTRGTYKFNNESHNYVVLNKVKAA